MPLYHSVYFELKRLPKSNPDCEQKVPVARDQFVMLALPVFEEKHQQAFVPWRNGVSLVGEELVAVTGSLRPLANRVARDFGEIRRLIDGDDLPDLGADARKFFFGGGAVGGHEFYVDR